MIKVGAQIVVEFGNGDIAINVNTGKLDKDKVAFVTLNKIEGGIVGRKIENKNQSIPEIFSNPLVLQFKNKQGIDSLISALEVAKKSFNKLEVVN
jgi:hypothetical protein